MNFELFIAKRLITAKRYKSSISAPIIKIAITAIALGVIIMLISVATGKGLEYKIRDKMSGFKGHIQIVNYDNNNSEITVVPIEKNQNFYPNFKEVDGVKNVQIYATKAGLIRTKTDFEGVVLKGVSTDYDWTFLKEYLVAGKLPDLNQDRTRDILVSQFLVNRLQLKLNDTISVFFLKEKPNKLPSRYKMIVTGIYNSGFNEFDKNLIVGDIREIQRLNDWNENQIGGFEVVINNFNDLQAIGDYVYKNTGATLDSSTIVENYPVIFEWVKVFENNTWFIIVIMILVAAINMVTALLVLVLERVQTIGILKSLGSSNWSIRKLFLYNASYLILRGIFWGNLIGLTLLFIQKYFKIIKLNPETYYVNTVQVYIGLEYILLLNFGVLVFTFLMMIIPSYIITKIQPSKSIKFS